MGGVAWTSEEDHQLRKCIQQYGEGKWHRVPLLAGLNRCRKSCRLRWLNYLRPNIKRGRFAEEEVEMIVKLHKLLGNRWSLIAGRLPGRTANDVKNYWNCHLSKKLNAKEAEEREMGRNMKVLRRQPRNAASSSANGKRLEEESRSDPAAEQGMSGNGISTPASFYVDGQRQTMLESDEEGKYACLDEQGMDGEVQPRMDFQFEQVRAMRNEEGSNRWDWDDFLLDVDLYI